MHLVAFFLLMAVSSTALAEAPALIVESELEAEDVEQAHSEAWLAYLTARRTTQIERLQSYASAGHFPQNTAQPGLANIFVDKDGRRCAMANLIWLDGEHALVTATAQTNNALLLGDVSEGALLDWLLTSGLTQQEAAFVQEPDFFLGNALDLPTREQLAALEQDRLRLHFTTAAAQLSAYSEASLVAAVAALGDRVNAPPPALPSA